MQWCALLLGHTADPALPLVHNVQLDWPGASLNEPAAHTSQAVLCARPVSAEDWPAAQSEQPACPS